MIKLSEKQVSRMFGLEYEDDEAIDRELLKDHDIYADNTVEEVEQGELLYLCTKDGYSIGRGLMRVYEDDRRVL